MKTILIAYLIASMVLVSPVLFLAEADSSSDTLSGDEQKVKHFMNFRGRPLPECRTFLITEISFLHQFGSVAKVSQYEPNHQRLTLDIGPMVNIDRHWAVGGSYHISSHSYGARRGLMLRLRRWLPIHDDGRSPFRVDLAAGPLLWLSETEVFYKSPGLMASLSLNFEDWLALICQVDMVRIEGSKDERFPINSHTDVSWYLGVKSGSYGSLIAVTSVFLLFVLTFEGPHFTSD